MTYAEGIKIRVRMCESYPDCIGCPLITLSVKTKCTCSIIIERNPEEAEAILERWDKEHPQKTIRDDFFEKFPNAPKHDGGNPIICPHALGYGDPFSNCIKFNLNCKDCWSRPLNESEETK
jgi:hypothetical protein